MQPARRPDSRNARIGCALITGRSTDNDEGEIAMDNDKRLSGRTVAMLVASGFAELEMTDVQKALVADGARPKVVSPEIGLANGWHEGTWGHNFYVEVKVGDVLPSQYDGLLVPGGRRSLDTLLNNAHAKRIVKGMLDAGKPVGVVSEGIELVLAVEGLRGRSVSSQPEFTEKLASAGAKLSDEPLTVDDNLITSTGGESLPQFIEAFLNAVDEVGAGNRAAA
jgi:protease I